MKNISGITGLWLAFVLLTVGPAANGRAVAGPGYDGPGRDGSGRDSLTVQPRFGLNASAGLPGFGLQLAYRLPTRPQLAVRAGFTYFARRRPFRLSVGDDSRLSVDPDLVISMAQASLKWHPFPKSSFFASLGGGYAWHPGLGAMLQAEDKLNLGGIEMTPDNVGVIRTSLVWSRLRGYAGLGFGRSVPRRRFGFGAELGVYYQGAPRVDLQYEGFLETTTLKEQVPTIEHNLRGYRWLPVLQFVFTYAIRPH
ncbi:hypothetical protein [Larkinella soli]|uniref:hypothetical protein n=1 Tax=Larkinella soli TaxID=1770527 RepID=UPI000FFBB054|nr:hypothetical protein [Larkinella soli]